MRVRFTESFDYIPSEEPRVLIAYRAAGGANKDGIYTVKRECGEAAVQAGAGEEVASDPLYHDQDGRKGGSLPKAKHTDAEA